MAPPTSRRTPGPITSDPSTEAELQPNLSNLLVKSIRRWLSVPAFAGTTDLAHSHRLPFTQRLGVARGDVGIVGVLADRRQNLPRARAFDAGGLFDHHAHARHIVEAKRFAGRLTLAHLVA